MVELVMYLLYNDVQMGSINNQEYKSFVNHFVCSHQYFEKSMTTQIEFNTLFVV